MKPSDIEKIDQWAASLNAPVSIKLILTGTPRDRELEQFCDELSGRAPQVRISRTTADDATGLPAILPAENLSFHVVPAEAKLTPFLDVLADKTIEDHATAAEPDAANAPAEFRLYVAAQCPFCPLAITQVTKLAGDNPGVRAAIIDVGLFPEKANEEKVQSVPLLILDDRFRWAGQFNLEEVKRVLANRNPEDISAATLEGLIREGRAGEVAQLMLSHRILIPGFIDLLTSPEWPNRLGAMVASEIIAGEDADLAAGLADRLWMRYDTVDEPVKGDILYMIGCCGMTDLLPLLEDIRNSDKNTELREAADEAAQSIRERTA